MISEKRYILRNTQDGDIYLQDFNPVIVIQGGKPSKKTFTANEINNSQDINIFITNGALEPVEVSETEGQLANQQINAIRASAPKVAVQRNFIRDGINVKDGVVSSVGTEDLGDSNILIPGTRVRLKGATNLTGILGDFSERMGRWAIILNDGRTAYANEVDIIDLDLGVNSQNTEGNRSVIYAEDVMKRGVVSPQDQMKRAGTMYAGDVIGRASRNLHAVNLSGKPIDNGERPGGRFNAQEVLGRPLINDGTNVEIINRTGQPIPSRRTMDEDQGTLIVEGQDGMAEEVSLNRVVKDTGNVMGKKMAYVVKLEAAKDEIKKTKYQLKKERIAKRAALKTEHKPVDSLVAPVSDTGTCSAADLAEFLSKPLHMQKFGISRMKDLAKLQAIADNATDDNIAMMAYERMIQLGSK